MNAIPKFRRILAVVALACAITGVGGVAYAAVPTIPTARDAWVSGVGKVSLRWDASTDASGHAIGYDIYRDVTPISAATIASRPLTPIVTNYVGLTVQLNAASNEASQAYVWYYAVVARDNQTTPLMSGPSLSISPNVHGYRMDSNVITCNRCHSTHGAYQVPLRTKELCYTCHGNTTAGSALAAKSSKNVQASFYDYSGQTAGSKHRNQYMIDNDKSCSACHSPHRSSYFYDSSGTYQATSSYRMMLRVTYGTSLYAYVSNNAAPATNNEACLGCHGATMVFDGKTITGSTSIALAGGPSAFANTGGDHNTAGYSASAHGNATIYANDYPATSPGVQCEVCHDNHGSATTRLIDYRRSRTTDPNANKQAGLCFKCHSASSIETTVAAGFAKPFAWNGRDVKAQFSLASRHPYVTTTTANTGSLSCVNCHNVHYNQRGTVGTVWQMVRAALPSNTKTNFTGTPTQFCLDCHDGVAPTATTTTTTVVPYTVAFSAQAASPFFPGWNKTTAGAEWAGSSHGASAVPNMTPGCDTCHDPHGSNNKRLTALTASGTGVNHVSAARNNTTAYSEQNLCYACHTSNRTPNCAGGACHNTAINSINVQTAFGLTYKHPVTVDGRHTDTETAAGLGASNRHSECADCHDPHAARSGLHTETSSTAGGALRGAVGIKPTAAWPANGVAVPAAGWTTERMTGQVTDYEAYVCFKCHSSYSGQPFSVTSGSGTYTSTDLSAEFNPSNFGEHNVLGQSVGMETSFTFKNDAGTTVTRSWDLPDPASVIFDTTPVMWGYNSGMTCSSCHSNSTAAAKGPHGSSVKYIIDPAYPTQWSLAVGDNPDTTGDQSTYLTTICNKCHANNYVSMNGTHKYTKHFRGSYTGGGTGGGKCIACHVKIPHGWKRPRLLGYRSDPANYSSLSLTAVLDKSITDAEASESSAGWDKANCITSGCDTHSTSKQGGSTYWP